MSIRQTVAKNLSFYRKKRGLSQKELADAIGVKHNTISSWENMVNAIDIDSLFQICQILNVDVNTMFGVTPRQNNWITNDDVKLLKKYKESEHKDAIDALLNIKNETNSKGDDHPSLLFNLVQHTPKR